jgi:hypothetical protein
MARSASRRAAPGDALRDERFRVEPLRAEALREEAFRVDPLAARRLPVLRLREEALLAWGTKAPFLSRSVVGR